MTDDVGRWKVDTPRGLVRAALGHAMLRGGKEVSFGTSGVSMVDWFGRRTGILGPARPGLGGVRDYLHPKYANGDGFRLGNDDVVEFPDMGRWTLTETEGTCVLKARKPSPPCFEAVCGADPSSLAAFRSLYPSDRVEVYLFCVGRTRTRDVALALASERHDLGLATTLDVTEAGFNRSPVSEFSPFSVWAPVPFDGTNPFAAHDATSAWRVEQVPYQEAIRRLSRKAVGDAQGGSTVTVCERVRDGHGINRLLGHVADIARPVVVVTVAIHESEPVATFAYSTGALALTSSAPLSDAPWDRYAARVAARRANRVVAPRTWHPNSEAVAKAYFARKAPRGFVSGGSLFFHGPVAYSIWPDNPVAAFVRTRDGVPTVVYGRDPGIGGVKGATVSMAMSDLAMASDDSYRAVTLGDLQGVLTLGGRPLDLVARSFRRDKNEAEFPSACEVDAAGLSTWFRERRDAGSAEIERSQGTRFATYAKADAYRRMASLAGLRETLATAFGVDLAAVGSRSRFDAMANEALRAANERKVSLEAARSAKRTVVYGADDDDDEVDYAHIIRM